MELSLSLSLRGTDEYALDGLLGYAIWAQHVGRSLVLELNPLQARTVEKPETAYTLRCSSVDPLPTKCAFMFDRSSTHLLAPLTASEREKL